MRALTTRSPIELAPVAARRDARLFAQSARRERRKQHRYCLHPSAAFSVGDGPLVPAHCRDISLGGAFLEAPVRPPFGARLRVHIWVEGSEQIVVDSTVRWTGAEGFGVQFGVMGARATHALVALFQGEASRPTVAAAASRRRYFRASRARLQRYRRRVRAIVCAAALARAAS